MASVAPSYVVIGQPVPRIEGKVNWTFTGQNYNMYQKEHDELFAAIRRNQPINNGKRMATSTLCLPRSRRTFREKCPSAVSSAGTPSMLTSDEGEAVPSISAQTVALTPASASIVGVSVKFDGATADTSAMILDN